jgi:hypothetical protein
MLPRDTALAQREPGYCLPQHVKGYDYPMFANASAIIALNFDSATDAWRL